jgi:hypothetical protein
MDHSWVEIRDAAKRKWLVTITEILSPTIKRGQGRKEYLEKREQILLGSAHLLEIDLLRKGKRFPMVCSAQNRPSSGRPYPKNSYF